MSLKKIEMARSAHNGEAIVATTKTSSTPPSRELIRREQEIPQESRLPNYRWTALVWRRLENG
jgi:hypothetical protein